MSASESSTPGDRVGQVLAGRYRLESLLGEGRAGKVYAGEHVLMKKRVAVKLLHPELAVDEEAVARFRREAEAASRLEHANVVAATDFGRTDDGSFFLVMDYVGGVSLRRALAGGPLSADRALRIARQIALALARAHREGIVHRDIKPENVMLVVEEDEPEHVKVLDFGLARIERETQEKAEDVLTRAGAVLGPPEYMAPEQGLGEPATAASDVYALGVVLFEMITGQRPFDGGESEGLPAHVLGSVPTMKERAPNADVGPPVEALVQRLLAGDPHARPSARECAAEIAALVPPVAPPAAAALDPENEGKAREVRGEGGGLRAVRAWLSRSQVRAARARAEEAIASWKERMQASLRGPRRRLVIAILIVAALVPLLTVGLLVRSSMRRSSSLATPSLVASGPSAAGEVASAEERRVAASAGVPGLEQLAERFPTDPAVLRELTFAYETAARTTDALHTIERTANAGREPLSPDLVRIVVRAAPKFETASEAFRLLEGPLGSDGVAGLLELSADAAVPPETRARATASLAKPEVRKNASEPLAFVLDLRAAKGCDAKRQILAKRGHEADGRALTTLRTLKRTYGCGRRGRDDCYECLRSDPHLDRTLRHAESRAAE